ncbi:MAG: enoyl-CoA hydratase/isomerase family protein [Fibrobacterota bacterium]
MSDSPFIFTVENDIAVLRLNSPPRNEMNRHFFACFTKWCRKSLPEIRARGLIIQGAGRHFSSGADVHELRRMFRSNSRNARELIVENTICFQMIDRLSFPVVAVITGCCLGSGLELALCCDYRIASPTAVLGLPEVSLGVIPGCGGSVRLPGVVGKAVALDMILRGKTMLAGDALSINLVDGLHDKKRLRERAEQYITGWWENR